MTAALLLATALAGPSARALPQAMDESASPAGPAASVVRFAPVPSGQVGYVAAYPEIYVEGPIDETTLVQLRGLVDANGLRSAKVQFNSRGGDLLAGLEIGYYLREKGFVTEVGAYNGGWGRFAPAECYSACAVAYLGGQYRFMDPGSRIAVHRFTTDRPAGGISPRDVEQETQALAGLLVAYIQQMGVDLAFFRRMSERPHEDLVYLDLEELRRLNVVNDGRMRASWGLEIEDDRVVLVGRQERIGSSATVTLICRGQLEIQLATQHFDAVWEEPPGLSGLQWILGDERLTVDTTALAGVTSLLDGQFRTAIALDPARAARLGSVEGIGLEVTAGGRRYVYQVALAGEADRQAIRRFVGLCRRSGGAELRSPGAG